MKELIAQNIENETKAIENVKAMLAYDIISQEEAEKNIEQYEYRIERMKKQLEEATY